MTRRPVVWALVHDLGRTGVPLALARLLAWNHGAGGADVHVVARHAGPLHSAVEPVASSVTTLEPAVGRSTASTVAVAAAELGAAAPGASIRDRWYRHRVRSLPMPDIVLVQGAGAWPLFASLEPLVGSARVVVHLHELAHALDRCVTAAERSDLTARADLVLAVAEPVAALARSLGAAATAVVPGTVDDPPAGWDAPIGTRADAVVSVGVAGWRKGTDRAIAIAHELARTAPSASCHWIGEPLEPGWDLAVGSAVPLVWHPPADDPWSVLGPSVVLVPSREDPLPLVALEAGARGLPVVAARTGGLTDLVAGGRGWALDGHDLSGLAAAVAQALAEPDEARRRGEALRSHVHEHHRTAVVGPSWFEALTGAS